MKYIILILVGIYLICAYIGIQNESPKYIRRDFKNGRSIEEEVDDSITSDNWDCTGKCSGHWAGYEWAERKGIDDPDDCGGNSVSFIEGCEAYANEY